MQNHQTKFQHDMAICVTPVATFITKLVISKVKIFVNVIFNISHGQVTGNNQKFMEAFELSDFY